MTEKALSDLRENYHLGDLNRSELKSCPTEQFQDWLTEAVQTQCREPNAMNLATANSKGQPSNRTVLLKGLDQRGFLFFTNYRSRKSQELKENPQAALTFLWHELERQVCIRGTVQQISREESLQYFHSRPRESQIGAWASEEQSSSIPNREILLSREEELRQKWPEGTEIPLPDFWGGWILHPESIEFWKGGPGRVHDRLQYSRVGEGWEISRLSP